MEANLSDVNKCVLEVFNDSNRNQNRRNRTQDYFIRVHQNNENSIRCSTKRNFNRNSENNRSIKRQNRRHNEHNLNNIANMDEIQLCNTPPLDVDITERHVSKFDTTRTKVVEKITFGNNRPRSWNQNRNSNYNSNNWRNKSHAWRRQRNKQRNRQLDNRERRHSKYTSSNYYNYANYSSSNGRTVNCMNVSGRNNQNTSLAVDEENRGCFMKLLDCLCLCMCGLFR